jgi:hypothetical protein
MNVYELKEEERSDPHIDLLTGFSFLDGQCRLMVVEGLRNGDGLRDLLEAVPRNERANSKSFKMLYNPVVGFSERLYGGFGRALLRQIKVRLPLEQLASKPELYSVQGVMNEETQAAMAAPKMLMEVKNKARLHALREGISFPKVQNLMELEILFGDYITDAELDGEPSFGERAVRERQPVKARAAAERDLGGVFVRNSQLRLAAVRTGLQ